MPYLVHHMLTESTARSPDREALVDGGRRLSYAAAAQQVGAIAAHLQALGVASGDRVAIQLKPDLDLPLAILGTAMAGAVFVPVHHGLFPDQVAHVLTDSGATVLVTHGPQLRKLEPVLPQAPALRHVVAKEFDGDAIAGLDVHDLDTIAQASAADLPDLAIGKDLAAIIYTSGSTGRPKGVMLSHANILAGARIVSDYLALTQDDRLLAALPLSFDAGLNQLTTALLTGAATVMVDFRVGRDITRRLADERITGLAGVPSLWSLLSQPSSGLSRRSAPDLRYITNTGGAMPQNVLHALRTALPGTDVVLMYGLTEAFRSTYLPPAELDRRPTSMGRAIPDTRILVVGADGKPCAPGEIGELVHHGPTVSLGYWGRPDLTQKVLRPHPLPAPGQAAPDLVCYSGDLVRADEDGYLYFVGRRDNQIKSAGFRISPTEVEEVVCDAGPVRQAAVVGVPDPILGQHLVAFVILREGGDDADADAMLARCSARMPRHMVPKRIVVTDTLPATASGKVDYAALRAMAGGGTQAEAQESEQEPEPGPSPPRLVPALAAGSRH